MLLHQVKIIITRNVVDQQKIFFSNFFFTLVVASLICVTLLAVYVILLAQFSLNILNAIQ